MTVNYLIDTCEDIKEEQAWVQAKLADLEDGSRHNNIKLRGVPESIQPADLPRYAKELMHTILTDASPRDRNINRIPRISKPPHLTASVPRDILIRVHFFHNKEKRLSYARTNSPLPPPYEGIQFFPDLSKLTLQLRRQLNLITKRSPQPQNPIQATPPSNIAQHKKWRITHAQQFQEQHATLAHLGYHTRNPYRCQIYP